MKITLQGQEYSLTFNMGFLRRVNKEYGLDLIKGVDLGGDEYFAFCEALLHCGSETISKEQATDLINSAHPKDVEKLVGGFQKWMTTPEEVIEKNVSKGGSGKAKNFHA